MSTILSTTPLRRLRPAFVGDLKAAHRYLAQVFGSPAAVLFAEPMPIMNGDRIAWQTELAGTFVPFSELPEVYRSQAVAALQQQVQAVQNRVVPERILHLLHQCLEVPGVENVFFTTESNGNLRAVLTLWGFCRDTVPTQASAVEYLLRQTPYSKISNEAPENPAVRITKKLNTAEPTISEEENKTQDFSEILAPPPPVGLPSSATNVHPAAMRMLHQHFDLGKYQLSVELPIHSKLYDKFAASQKYYVYYDKKPQNWEQQYLDMFLSHPDDEPLLTLILRELAAELQTLPPEADFQLVEAVVAYVQGGLKYDFEKLSEQNRTKRYPYETVFLGCGVCEDKTLLLAKLLILLDYSVALLAFEKANHIAVGLRVERDFGQFDANGQWFCFVETTDYSPIGVVPQQFPGGVWLDEAPRVILPSRNGSKTFDGMGKIAKRNIELKQRFGDAYLNTSAKGKQLLESITDIKNRMQSHRERQEISAYNDLVDHYNNLIGDFNNLSKNT